MYYVYIHPHTEIQEYFMCIYYNPFVGAHFSPYITHDQQIYYYYYVILCCYFSSYEYFLFLSIVAMKSSKAQMISYINVKFQDVYKYVDISTYQDRHIIYSFLVIE